MLAKIYDFHFGMRSKHEHTEHKEVWCLDPGDPLLAGCNSAHVAFKVRALSEYPTIVVTSFSMAATVSAAQLKPGMGDFSAEQNKHINELYTDFVLKCGSSGSTEVQAWIDRTAKELFEEAVFADRRVPPTGGGILTSATDDPKLHQATMDALGRPLFAAVDWIALIKKKFANWKKKREVVAAIDQYAKSTAPTGTPSLISTAASSASSATFFGCQPVTAREIHAREHEAKIKSAANEAKLREGGNSAQHYQATLKQRWDALRSEEKEVYAARAHSEAWDVEANQEVFKAALYRELSHICNSGMMGQIVIGCEWAMREPTGKLISADVLAGTNESNTMEAVAGADTWKAVIAAFRNMAQKELPGKRVPHFYAETTFTSPSPSPCYRDHGRATEEPVNWNGLIYDQTAFTLPSKLENLDTMTWQIGALMEDFMDQSHPLFVLLRVPISDTPGGEGPKDGDEPPEGNADSDNGGAEGDIPGDIRGDKDSDKDDDKDDAPAGKGKRSGAKKVKGTGKPKAAAKPKAAPKPKAAAKRKRQEEPLSPISKEAKEAAKKEADKGKKRR
ncbi:hypothetical protein B0H16DRAFT_1474800 [Mycena metata]|uniref:Uncharacterized protein n=1 Tax=Mycena metata TaxID=1033252 RepID=A0AAD7MJ40_9AGAR|nr:hypothetical protein B0H16DRAFT_1474800 [Mycena metata]